VQLVTEVFEFLRTLQIGIPKGVLSLREVVELLLD
jgi:hypothetical protein